ncbi:MAG: xanthine dehydrogenase family protein molybdopterin-binding subunit [Alphaproteobacteria bacterium]|nr:MAG: xanthine dehydrogenase family protein molybdopterin-binding subunit [Alphaproteobacteria bacterium]
MTYFSRRAFLKTGTAGTAALFLVGNTPRLLAADAPAATGTLPPILRLDTEGGIVLAVPAPDMGQGTVTMAAQLIADELDVALEHVRVELMPFVGAMDDKGKAAMGPLIQGAGGSLTTQELWAPLRQTAAYIRGLLVEAAASRWKVAASGLKTAGAHVTGGPGGARLAYTALIPALEGKAAPADLSTVKTRGRGAHTEIGADRPNADAPAIVRGQPIYGLDQTVPGMLHAVIRRCPHLQGELEKFDASAALKMPGVVAVHEIKARKKESGKRLIAAGVAVVAESLWQAKKAAATVECKWNGTPGMDTDSELVMRRAFNALDIAEMATIIEDGDIETAFRDAAKVVEATYSHPTWAHACMEPHSCIADVRADSAEIWVGHQFMDEAINAVAITTGLKSDRITGHFYRMGTAFGRKFEKDYITEACILSGLMKKPVKVTWSREDEMEQDYYNPMGAYRLRGALDKDGKLTAMHVRAVADGWSGHAAREIPQGILDHYKGEWMEMHTAVSNGAWRGPGSNTRAWVTMGFLNELAVAAGKDPLDFLIELFSRKPSVKHSNWPNRVLDLTRYVAMLRRLETESGYRTPLARGRGRGVAIFNTHYGVCGHVAEVEMIGDKDFRVLKVTSVVDCGLPVNPNGVRAQIESGIIDGLDAAKYGKMVFRAGVPTTNNFDSYRKLRIDEAPAEVNIHIMDFGDEDPRGTGEISLPPFIPALTNAIFAASGKRVHTLPISENL